MSTVRVRFAPSPTGPLHIGGVRTALFNYLFAKKHGGTFVLRIEDTDQNRYVKGAEQYIKDALEWCGFPYEEGPGKEGNFGPYRQSERKHLYKEYADRLIEEGKAYYAFDSAESLDTHRKDHEAKGKTFIYNWHNRLKLDNSLVLDATEVEQRIARGDKYVVRFKSPQDEILVLNDEIRGEIKIDTNVLDDKILFKSDGMPTYHLANILDDHLMEITHVIRGEEWLPSLALHELLYRAFEWKAPKFAHLPLILKPTGKGKLSKRDGDKGGFPVFPLEWKTEDGIASGFREDGYLPEAVTNFLAFLGWNPGTEQELFSLEELVEAFDLQRVNKAGAKFDPEKAKWFNQQYFVKQDDETIAKDFIARHPELTANKEYITKVVSLIKERAVFTTDLWDLSSFFFEAPTEYDAKALKKAIKEDTPVLLNELIEIVNGIEDFSADNLQDTIKGWITSKEIGFGKVMQPLRLSLVGAMKGPDVFEIMSLLGKEESVNRLQAILNK
ncbi:glutamate--tRNA ligase [Pseudofulvibacter geojedonensis]|uniref:Glutamate--tRNA ligase n=1 Tax=Pseudofulvibacter geojedonensis TaxID=1123758 RepID=A0ABW3I583_9FLAO